MKQKLSALLVCALLLSCTVCTAYAAEQSPFSVTQAPDEVYVSDHGSSRVVKGFHLSIPCDGAYHDIWSGELKKGDTVDIQGTWGPSYAGITIEIIEQNNKYATLTTMKSGESNTLRIQESGTYTIHIRSDEEDITGTIIFDIKDRHFSF